MLMEMQKFPIIGDRFVKSIPASDNVCGLFFMFGYAHAPGSGFAIGIWKSGKSRMCMGCS